MNSSKKLFQGFFVSAFLCFGTVIASAHSFTDIRDIYTAVSDDIANTLERRQRPTDLYVINNSYLRDVSDAVGLRGKNDSLLVRRLRLANRTPILLEPYFARPDTTFISVEKFDQWMLRSIAERDRSRETGFGPCFPFPWDIFYRNFPNAIGVYYFSRVGFSTNGERAMVEVNWSQQCGGAYHIYTLVRQKGSWLIQKKTGVEMVV